MNNNSKWIIVPGWDSSSFARCEPIQLRTAAAAIRDSWNRWETRAEEETKKCDARIGSVHRAAAARAYTCLVLPRSQRPPTRSSCVSRISLSLSFCVFLSLFCVSVASDQRSRRSFYLSHSLSVSLQACSSYLFQNCLLNKYFSHQIHFTSRSPPHPGHPISSLTPTDPIETHAARPLKWRK